MIQISDMSAFVAVVEMASFTEAARRLGTTKSVISRRISDLERELGAPLLDRGSRSVRATEVGAVYYAKCVRILESICAANDFVSGFNNLVKGRLRVAVPKAFGAQLIIPLLTEFAVQYPEVMLEIDADDKYVSLSDTQFDLAIRVGRLGDSALIARPLARFRYWLCASPAYLEQRGTPRSPDALGGHDGLIEAGDEGQGAWPLLVDGEPRTFRVRERMRSNDYQQLLAAACAGLGIARLPSLIAADAVAGGQLRVLLSDNIAPPSDIAVVYPKSRRTSQKVQALLAFLTPRVAALVGGESREIPPPSC